MAGYKPIQPKVTIKEGLRTKNMHPKSLRIELRQTRRNVPKR